MSDKKQNDDKQDEQNSEFQNFQRLLKGTLAVPKEEVDQKRDKHERSKQAKGRREQSDQ